MKDRLLTSVNILTLSIKKFLGYKITISLLLEQFDQTFFA